MFIRLGLFFGGGISGLSSVGVTGDGFLVEATHSALL